jgi:hypothetical protein
VRLRFAPINVNLTAPQVRAAHLAAPASFVIGDLIEIE